MTLDVDYTVLSSARSKDASAECWHVKTRKQVTLFNRN
jgi:hypothetical protein